MKKCKIIPLVKLVIITLFVLPVVVSGQTTFTDARDSISATANPPYFTGTKGDLGNLPRDVSISNVGFTADSGELGINGKAPVRTAWVYFTAASTGSATITVSNITSGGARLAVYNLVQDNPFYNNSVNNKIGEADTVGGSASLNISVSSGKYYAVQLDSSTAGNIRLIISGGAIPPPPSSRYNLVVSVSPSGSGTVNVSPQQPTNGYASGTIVTLTASGTDTFQGWTGSANGTDTSLNVTMNAPKTITAHFGPELQILFGNTEGQLAVWFLNGTTFNGAAFLRSSGAGWRLFGTGNFNTDTEKDYLFQYTDGRVAYWFMNGNRFVSGGVLGNPGAAWRAVGVSDFDADGDPDILFQHTDGRLVVWFLNGITYQSGVILRNGVSPGSDWKAAGVKDFNGDGKGDILFQHTNGQIAVWYMNGTTFTGGAAAPNAGPNWRIASLGDFNADGKTDFVWQNSERKLAVWLMNGITYVSGTYLRNGIPLASGWQVFSVK